MAPIDHELYRVHSLTFAANQLAVGSRQILIQRLQFLIRYYTRTCWNNCVTYFALMYSVSQKIPHWGFVTFFPKRLGIFALNFTRLLYVPVYARLQIFIQLPATLTKLCHIKRHHSVHIICSKCWPLAKTHAEWSHLISYNFITEITE